jgi:hypothetical protein
LIILVQWVDDFDFFGRIHLGRQFFEESHEILVILFLRIQLEVGITQVIVKHFLGFTSVLILCEQELKLFKIVLGVAEHARYDFCNFFQTSTSLTDGFFAKNDDRQNTLAFFGCFYESILIGNVKLGTSGVL